MNFKRILNSFFVVFLSISSALSQQVELDSLINVYQSYSQTDSIQISILNEIAYKYYTLDIVKSEEYADLAYEKSIEVGNKFGEARALTIKAIAYNYKGDNQKSIELVQEAARIADEINSNVLKCRISNSLGILYSDINLNNKAIEYWKNAIEECGAVKDTSVLGYINANLGELHVSEKNYEKALEYLNEVIRLGQLTNDCDLISIALDEVGGALIEQGKLNEAEEKLVEALNIRKSCNGEGSYLARIYTELAKVKLLKDELTEVKLNLERSENHLKNTGATRLSLDNIEIKTELLLRLNDKQQAINTLKKGILIAKDLEELNHEASFKDKLSSIYGNTGNYKEAFIYKSESKILYDSLSVLSKSQRILDLEKKYGLEKNESELKLLHEQQIKDAQIIKSRTYFNIATILFAILVGVIAFFTWLNLKREAKYSTQLESKVNERTEELKHSNEMLASSNQELERFAYISSHDLKEPLKNITSFTKLIHKESLKSNLPKITEYSSILENCSNQLNTLVSDILDYSMVKSDFKIQDVDLNNIVNQLQSDLNDTLTSNNGVITADQLPNIKSDKSKMYQAFKNIIENGIKYNKSEIPSIKITSEESPTNWIIKFADNGIGIDSKHHNDIFVMFKRLHNKDEYPGSGIGLSTLKTIVEKLNGTISLDSTLNQGSKFTITLPKVLS